MTTDTLCILTGASRGMGLAIAQQLLRPGCTLLCISRHANEALAAEARTKGAALTQWTADLADPVPVAERVQAWLRQQDAQRFARAALINNAGVVSAPGPLQATPLAEASRALRVGVEAALLLTAAFLDATDGWAGDRRVLNISSGLGRHAMAGSATYCAAKAGMDHFSRAVALEQAGRPHGARIVSLAPGVIDTEMQQQLRGADAARFPERERFAQLKAQGLLDSPAQAAAKVIAYLERPDFGAQPVADVRG
jgi:NAD(P)-dependent dehydrogenase (short-subunit alcohol dehydrogenase family)